jgi:hypothetical protein
MNDVPQSLFHHDAKNTAPGLMPAGHECQPSQAGNGHVALVLLRAESAVYMLATGKKSQALVNGLLGSRRNHVVL